MGEKGGGIIKGLICVVPKVYVFETSLLRKVCAADLLTCCSIL